MWRHDVPEPALSRGGSGRGSPSASSDTRHQRKSKSNMKCIISVGLLLPALAAVIGVVAWAVSAEAVIGAKRDSIKADSAIRYQDQRTSLSSRKDAERDFDLKTSSRPSNDNSRLKAGTSLTSGNISPNSKGLESRKPTNRISTESIANPISSGTSGRIDEVPHNVPQTSNVGLSASHAIASQDGVNDFVGQLLNTPRDPSGKVRQFVIVPVPDVSEASSSQLLLNQNSQNRHASLHAQTTSSGNGVITDNHSKSSLVSSSSSGTNVRGSMQVSPSRFDHSGALSHMAPSPLVRNESPIASATTTHRTFIQPAPSSNLPGSAESLKVQSANTLGPHRKGEQAIPPASETISTPDNAYQSPFSPVVGTPSRYGNAPQQPYRPAPPPPPPPPPPPQPYPQGGGYGGPPPVNHGYNSYRPAGERTLISVHPAEQYGGSNDRGSYDHGPWHDTGHYHHSPPAKGITVHLGGTPGHGSEVVTSPLGLFKTLLLPLLPKPKVNLNGKVVFGVVLEKGVGFGGNKHAPAAQIHTYAHHGGHHY